MYIDQNANTSASTSVGGAVLLDNSGNAGAGLVVYSTQGASGTGHLIASRVNNANFPQSAIYATSNGASHTINIQYAGTDSSSAAASFVSSNVNFTALQVTGEEAGHGTIKVAHVRHNSTTNDQNAAALSIDLQGEGTSAQGIFIDSTYYNTNVS